MTYADVAYYLFYGYLNSTLGFTTINQQKCIGLIAEFYVNLTRDVPAQVKTQRFRDFAVTTSQALRNVDPAWKACLWTVDDGYDLYWLQGVSLDDLFRIIWNLVYRFGNLVDRVSELVSAFTLGLVKPYLAAPEWEYVGGLIGRIGVEILFPSYYPDLPIVYPED